MARSGASVMHRVASFLQEYGEQQVDCERKQLIARLNQLAKSQSIEKLKALIAMIEGKVPDTSQECFPRGVRQMGGMNTTAVPLYIAKRCLAIILNLSEGLVTDLDEAPVLRHLFLWAFAAEDSAHQLICDIDDSLT